MSRKDFYIAKIDKIAKESFNAEQKAIAKKIIKTTDEKDLDEVWGFISQRIKIGFTFDEAPEINQQAVAVVKENEKMFISSPTEKNTIEHKLIIGENYDALKNLLVTYVDSQGKGLIDVIYIDPPYNTEKSKEEGNDYKDDIEAKKFVYRDKFTRDGWLNMMNERLKLAKRLLSDNGVVFISIDDSEQAYLKVLCDEIFGENKIETYIWCLQDKSETSFTKTASSTVRKEHEYIIAGFKGEKAFGKYSSAREFESSINSNPDNDPRGNWFSGNISRNGIKTTTGSKYYTITSPTGTKYTRNWTLSEEEYKKALKDNRIHFPKNGSGVPRLKIFPNANNYLIQSSLFTDVHTSITGKNELKSIFNTEKPEFDFPKPTSLIIRLLEIVNNSNAIVLDFFAGSGTTGQAVMELNEEDEGNRKFILVTNNENNLATKITRERLYRVINGKGSKGEKIKWEYSKEKKSLINNTVRVFDIKTEGLTITDIDKAEKIKTEAEKDFKKLNEKYKQSDLDIYTQLASLKPQRKEK